MSEETCRQCGQCHDGDSDSTYTGRALGHGSGKALDGSRLGRHSLLRSVSKDDGPSKTTRWGAARGGEVGWMDGFGEAAKTWNAKQPLEAPGPLFLYRSRACRGRRAPPTPTARQACSSSSRSFSRHQDPWTHPSSRLFFRLTRWTRQPPELPRSSPATSFLFGAVRLPTKGGPWCLAPVN